MMTTHRLDELAEALQATLSGCQDKLDQQQAKRLRQTINLDDDGRPEFLTCECRLPSGDGDEQHFEMLRLPWSCLPTTETLNIAEISIELDCQVRKTSRRAGNDQTQLIATPLNRNAAEKEETHRIKLSSNQQEPEASVVIDGVSVEEFIAEQFSPEQKEKDRAQKKHRVLIAIILLTALCLTAAITYLALVPWPKF